MEFNFRKAETQDTQRVWEILQQAILRRKTDGSSQWQSDYPNLNTVKTDVKNGNCYLLESNNLVVACSSIIFNDEPTYEVIDGKWLSSGDFLVIHRLAVADDFLGKGIASCFFKFIEEFAVKNNIFSIKADTNFDNPAMLRIFKKLNFVYCGEIQVFDGPRKAYEKLLN